VVRLAVPLLPKPQVRGSYHRTPYGVASSWYAATPEGRSAGQLPQPFRSTETSAGAASPRRAVTLPEDDDYPYEICPVCGTVLEEHPDDWCVGGED
jgi:hypothetical protein